jgi:hypothetical protein
MGYLLPITQLMPLFAPAPGAYSLPTKKEPNAIAPVGQPHPRPWAGRPRTRRLAKLEAAHAPPSGRFDYRRPFHQIIADSDAEADAECQAVIADGRAQPGDNFIMHIIVTPPAREAA